MEETKILTKDLSSKTEAPSREPIGFVMRGDLSQARGHPVALAVISDASNIARLKSMQPNGFKKGSGTLALFRTPSSLIYHFGWIFPSQ